MCNKDDVHWTLIAWLPALEWWCIFLRKMHYCAHNPCLFLARSFQLKTISDPTGWVLEKIWLPQLALTGLCKTILGSLLEWTQLEQLCLLSILAAGNFSVFEIGGLCCLLLVYSRTFPRYQRFLGISIRLCVFKYPQNACGSRVIVRTKLLVYSSITLFILSNRVWTFAYAVLSACLLLLCLSSSSIPFPNRSLRASSIALARFFESLVCVEPNLSLQRSRRMFPLPPWPHF